MICSCLTCFSATRWRLGSIFLLLLTGCSETFDVKVNAIHDPKATGGNSYRIEPLDPMLAEQDPNYGRAVRLVQAALSGKGMYEAPNPDDAEVVVGVDYGLGSPRTEYKTVDPMMQMDPMMRMGLPVSQGGRMGTYPTTMGGSTPIVTESGTIEAKRVYDKYLTIVARRAKADDPGQTRGREIWRVDVTVEDEKQDVGRVLPVLAGAAADHIDVDTHDEKMIRVNEKSDSVEFVKQGP